MKKPFLLFPFLLSLLLIPSVGPVFAQHLPWNVEKLKQIPGFQWQTSDTARVRQILYEGEKYGPHPHTQVFAYYATPGSLSGKPADDRNLPAIVLVHGGGGKAFREWAELWAKRGYAALAMDLGGNGADGKRLPLGGPDQNPNAKFRSIDSTADKQWVYHAVANVIRAHSLLRSLPGVDSSRTALTGISWGGFLTCIVAGLDNRFKVAVPVYGCGFIDEPGGFFHDKELGDTPPDQRKRWMDRFDPSHFVGQARMPMLWVNGTNDRFYPPTSFSQTYDRVKSPKNYRITTTMKHGHREGWEPQEIGWFVDSYLTGGKPLPVLGAVSTQNGNVVARVTAPVPLTSATLAYTTDTSLPFENRRWTTVPAALKGNQVMAPAPPPDATIWLLNVVDERGAIVSSPFQFRR
ncbi:hypothetical protein GCM10028803_61140 [Larkinella knui]|uniref:Alpha/beta fold hydrolase n=1 Tax=Larkinella knui TaxID=2025310 RepID=A0A3P1CB11_9BACT|nr:acetylxylan esterase [Larkinella knui]RRB10448.1 alpha/beta fold hydrolase [Larkinella knui]